MSDEYKLDLSLGKDIPAMYNPALSLGDVYLNTAYYDGLELGMVWTHDNRDYHTIGYFARRGSHIVVYSTENLWCDLETVKECLVNT